MIGLRHPKLRVQQKVAEITQAYTTGQKKSLRPNHTKNILSRPAKSSGLNRETDQ
jgi:hypothetical protein